MKRIILILFSACLLIACSKETAVELVSFTDTGCSKGTKAPETKAWESSQLILEYTDARHHELFHRYGRYFLRRIDG